MCHLTCRFPLAALIIGTSTITVPALAQVINEDLKLLAEGGDSDGSFGRSISIDNGIVAIGRPQGFSNTGSAYLFDASTGTQLFKLLPADGANGDFVGISIAIHDGTVAVGAYEHDGNGSGSGSVYLFDASTGSQLFKLLPNDGAMGDLFGWSVAINNGVVAVGARRDDDNGINSGSAYLFDATTGVQTAKLLPADGDAGDWFGYSIAISNGIVAVGANLDDNSGFLQNGSAYLFDASTGTQITKLLPKTGVANHFFGESIAINNNTVAVGALQNGDDGVLSGSAYLFNTTTGMQIAKLLPDDLADEDIFGGSIALNGGIVAVGSRWDDDTGGNSGSAYLFDASTGIQLGKLLPSDGQALNNFGISVSIDAGVVAVGAGRHESDSFPLHGSAYLFTVPETECPADFTGEGSLDIFDILAFLDAFNNADPLADFTGDGNFDIFDILAFLDAFNAGCP